MSDPDTKNAKKSFDFEDNVTYKAEGNDNPKSRWFSRKLHHSSFNSGVTIGRGYDLRRSVNEIRQELSEAGFPQEKIEFLVKASQLSGNQASEFVKNNTDFEISLKEQQSLFQVIYPKYEQDAKRLFSEDWEKLSRKHQELLVDLRYRGDINTKTKKFLRPAIKKMIETKDPSHFERIFADQKLWIDLKCDMNRIKLRRQSLQVPDKINDSFYSNASTIDSSTDAKVNVSLPKGGIDLNIDDKFVVQKPRNYKFCGIIFDKNKDELFLLQKENESKNSQIKLPQNMVNLEDLAVILKIFCDPCIKHKIISFSLDPYEKNNPQGKFMRKVYFPDQLENKRILAGTKLGEAMFEADYIMKQMSLGIQPDNINKFQYPEELKKLGLKSQFEMREGNKVESSQEMKWSRAWIVVNEIRTFKKKEDFLIIDGVKMGVEARQMNVGCDGSLKDSMVQDKTDECYKFSQKLAEVYDKTMKYYKSFERLKEISNAIILAKWIFENNIPVDLDIINEIYQNSLIEGYEEKVPSISYREVIETEEKIPVELNDLAKRSLEHSKLEVTPSNIKLALKQIQEKNPGKVFYDTRIKKHECFLFGGVDLTGNFSKKETEKNLLDEQNSQSTNDESLFEESKTQNIGQFIVKKKNVINADLTELNVKRFPFLVKEFCSICERPLSLKEVQVNRFFRKMIGKESYCNIHSPFNCGTCLKVIKGNYVAIKSQNYHSGCIVCFGCNKKIKEATMVCEHEMLFHKECYEIYLKDIAEVFNVLNLNEEKDEIFFSTEKEKRKSEEFENLENKLKKKKMDEMKDNQKLRGKTFAENKQSLLLQKIKKK